MNASKLGAAMALVAGTIGLMAHPASAASITFDDSGPGGTVTVSACDFENGAFVDGTLMGLCGSGYGGSVTVAESAVPISFSGGWIDLGLAGAGSRTIYIVEAGAPTLVSDKFTYSWVSSGPNSANILADFLSATSGDLGPLPLGVDPADVFVENGQPVRFELAFLTGQLLTANAVPEPGGMVLVGLGLAGVAFSRRQKV